MLQIPKILESHFLENTSLSLEWNKDMDRYLYYEYINEELSRTLWGLNHKSTVGLATALAEWILWRLSKTNEYNFTLAISMLEPMWAGLIDKHYIKLWIYKGRRENDVVRGLLWVTLKCMNDVRFNYIKGKMFINEKVSTLGYLAQIITPNTQFFESWLRNCINKATNLFPAEYDRSECNDPTERYNSTHELPIPRQFFWEEDFDYQSANVNKLLSDFISSLDYTKNEFLNSPEEMIENGFEGTPYKYELK